MYSKSENTILEKLKNIALRSIILYFFSLLFKMFDLTYPNDINVFRIRGTAFSIFFVAFGLLVWEISAYLGCKIDNLLASKKVTSRLIILGLGQFFIGVFISLSFSYIYSSLDIFIFGRGMWDHGPVIFDFQLNMALLIFYLLILSYRAVIFYHSHWREEQLFNERLLRENLQTKYDTLKNQLDSHFLFNSLSVLTNLVYKDPDLSAEYIARLSRMFRYVLESKEKSVVNIKTELEFLQAYLFLMNIRYPNSIITTIDLKGEQLQMYIPPATLQLLVENAIKHNKFDQEDPIKIGISADDEFIYVQNNLNERPKHEFSLGLGLDNIRKRMELIAKKSIQVEKSNNIFKVKIPLITDQII